MGLHLFLLILLGFFLLLPPAIYPWFRSQEALPHHAVAAALCAVSLAVLRKAAPACRSLAWRRIIRSVAPASAAAALGITLCGGLRTSDAFAMADVRSECRDWINESAPAGARFGTELPYGVEHSEAAAAAFLPLPGGTSAADNTKPRPSRGFILSAIAGLR